MTKCSCQKSRRDFIKTSAAGAAGILAGGLTSQALGKNAKTQATAAWKDRQPIHPDIHNLRVALLKDSKMVIGGNPIKWDFISVNEKIDRNAVHGNLDTMAKYITQKANAGEAWKTIFRKPTAKQWKDVRVALKVNGIEPKQMVKIAIVEKVCLELGKLGVPNANMIVWCGVHNAVGDADTPKYDIYTGGKGLPAGVKVSDRHKELGETVPAPVPAPWSTDSDCTADLATGKVDILINFAVNKGHSTARGSTTLAMKNHFGTFSPNPAHDYSLSSDQQFGYLVGINKSAAILGGEFPRQQLVIVDSIFAMTGGPTGQVTHAPHMLVMGLFAPAVDYATVKFIREPVMKASHSSYMEKFLTSFGYTQQEQDDFVTKKPAENNGMGVGMLTPETSGTGPGVVTGQGDLIFHLTAGRFLSRAVKIPFSDSDKIQSVSIFNAGGKLVRKLGGNSFGGRGIVWDGLDNTNRVVRKGSYYIRVLGRRAKGSGVISL